MRPSDYDKRPLYNFSEKSYSVKHCWNPTYSSKPILTRRTKNVIRQQSASWFCTLAHIANFYYTKCGDYKAAMTQRNTITEYSTDVDEQTALGISQCNSYMMHMSSEWSALFDPNMQLAHGLVLLYDAIRNRIMPSDDMLILPICPTMFIYYIKIRSMLNSQTRFNRNHKSAVKSFNYMYRHSLQKLHIGHLQTALADSLLLMILETVHNLKVTRNELWTQNNNRKRAVPYRVLNEQNFSFRFKRFKRRLRKCGLKLFSNVRKTAGYCLYHLAVIAKYGIPTVASMYLHNKCPATKTGKLLHVLLYSSTVETLSKSRAAGNSEGDNYSVCEDLCYSLSFFSYLQFFFT